METLMMEGCAKTAGKLGKKKSEGRGPCNFKKKRSPL